MPTLRTEYDGCPICGGPGSPLGNATCAGHRLWHEPLPKTLEWMSCQQCTHVYTRHYWTEAGQEELFRNAHAGQLAGSGDLDAKREIWRPVVDKAVELIGGYRAVCAGERPPVWVDIGCGDGSLLMTAADYGFTAIGLDARTETIERIKTIGYPAVQGEFETVQFEGPVDVLSMMDALEHMPFPHRALEKAGKVLRPGGLLIVSTPDSAASSWKLLDLMNANPYWAEIEHHHNFSRHLLIQLLGARGFETVSFSVPYRYKAQMELYALNRNVTAA